MERVNEKKGTEGGSSLECPCNNLYVVSGLRQRVKKEERRGRRGGGEWGEGRESKTQRETQGGRWPSHNG